ncbi:MAG: hypothetical protein KDE54_16365, partial [Caldilineaceae bacterium]|nr:hypothetical protein [Caldilineaceae bacterium]
MQHIESNLSSKQPRNLPPPTYAARANQRKALLIGGGYLCAVILVVGLGSNFLYNWARQRIVQSSPLNALQEINVADNPVFATQDEPVVAVAQADQSAAPEESNRTSVTSQHAINVLLLGTDARPEDTEAARTDTIILLTLDPQSKTGGM